MPKTKILSILLITLMLSLQVSSWCFKASISESDTKLHDVDTSPDNHYLLAVSKDGDGGKNKLYIYDTLTYTKLATLSMAEDITTARYSKDGRFIAVGYENGEVDLISGEAPFTTTAIHNYKPSGNDVQRVDFSWDNTKLLICYQQDVDTHIVHNYNTTASSISSYSSIRRSVTCRFSKNDDIVQSNRDEEVTVFTPPAYTTTSSVVQFNNDLQGLDVKPTSATPIKIIAGGTNDDKGHYFMDGDTSETTLSFVGGSPSDQIQSVCYSYDGQYFAFASKGNDRGVYIYTDATNTNTETFTDSPNKLQACRFSWDSEYLYTSTDESSDVAYINVYSRNCTVCAIGYYPTSSSDCQLCESVLHSCAACTNETSCSHCFQGYFLNTTTNKCVHCPLVIDGCSTCLTDTYCTECVMGYYEIGGVCRKCHDTIRGCQVCNGYVNPLVCQKCQIQWFLKGGNCNQCFLGVSFCLRCTTQTNCVQCQNGFYGSNCAACDIKCQSCEGTSTNCSACVRGFYLNGNTCTDCPHGCLECNDTSYCFTCKVNTYLLANGTCQYCDDPCSSCNTSSTDCLSCDIGHFLVVNVCNACDNNCSTCVSLTNCSSCYVGFYLTAIDTCEDCWSMFSFCQSCNSTHCLSCNTGYYLAANYTCQPCSIITNCLACESSILCIYCASGYYTAGTTCDLCPIGCQTCATSTNCTNCKTGFYPNTTTFGCDICQNNCMTCRNESYCQECNVGYYEDNNTCRWCGLAVEGCLQCFNSSACVSCEIGLYLENGTSCARCLPYCTVCNSTSDCRSCELGFYLESLRCEFCVSPCSECTSLVDCLACDVGYFLNTTASPPPCQICSDVASGCLTCNLTHCFSCQQGFYIDSTANKCEFCTTAMVMCLTCNDSTTCNFCARGYYLMAGNTGCLSCGEGIVGCDMCWNQNACSICKLGFYLHANASCQSCPQKCLTCDNNTICITCAPSYTLNTSIPDCVHCESYMLGCQLCQSPTQCTKCTLGYYLHNSSCISCRSSIAGCYFCNSSSICFSCQEGYYLDGNTCSLCSGSQGCQLCNSSAICVQCQSGYYLSGVVCLGCEVGVVGCVYCTNSSYCNQCLSGYYLDSTNQCSQCSSSMEGCIFCNTSSTCLQCESGFFLNTTTIQCQRCSQKGCQTCQESQPTQCLSCNSGYYLNSTSFCVNCQIVGCLDCNGTASCVICETGYYLSAGGCLLCSGVLGGCNRCDNSSLCLGCQSLYYLGSSGSCEQCSGVLQGCQFCTNSSQCMTCSSAYFMNSSSQCEPCTNIAGCLLCASAVSCLSCQTGYYMIGATCNPCTVLPNCYDCINATTCESCYSGFTIAQNKSCGVLELSSGSTDSSNEDMSFKTYYVSQQRLKHVLYVRGMDYVQAEVVWADEVNIYLEKGSENVPLVIQQANWGSNGYSIIFFTDNPLDMSTQSMPFSARLLTGQSIATNYHSSISVKKETLTEVLPNLMHQGELVISYSLQDPQFYKSYIQQTQTTMYYIFGLVVTIFLAMIFAIKACCTVPYSNDLGEIIGHVFAIKIVPMVLYPVYAEYLDYAYGFMTADLPWANLLFGELFGSYADDTPNGYSMFFVNLNVGATYFLGLAVIGTLLFLGYLAFRETEEQRVRRLKLSHYQYYKYDAYFQLIFNFFSFGIILASCGCFQGALLNPTTYLSLNGFFYMSGIMIYLSMMGWVMYSVYSERKYNRMRIFVKASLLSAGHFNPVYIVCGALVVDLIGVWVQYWLRRKGLVCGKAWVLNNVLANGALCLFLYVPDSMVCLIFVSMLVVTVLAIELYMHYNEKQLSAQNYPKMKPLSIFDPLQDNSESIQDNIFQITQSKLAKEYQKQDNKIPSQLPSDMNQTKVTQFISTKYDTKYGAMGDTKKRSRRFRSEKNETKVDLMNIIVSGKGKKDKRNQKGSDLPLEREDVEDIIFDEEE